MILGTQQRIKAHDNGINRISLKCNGSALSPVRSTKCLSDGHTIATTSRRPMTTDDYRQPITDQIFDRKLVADQLQTNCQSLGDRTPTEFRIIIKIWKPIGDWLSQNERLVGNHSAIDCQAHKRSFDVMHKFVTSFVFLMHRKDFGAKIWTLFLKRNCNNRMIKESSQQKLWC